MNYQRLSSLKLIIYNCGSLHVYKLLLRKQYALNLNTFFMREKRRSLPWVLQQIGHVSFQTSWPMKQQSLELIRNLTNINIAQLLFILQPGNAKHFFVQIGIFFLVLTLFLSDFCFFIFSEKFCLTTIFFLS